MVSVGATSAMELHRSGKLVLSPNLYHRHFDRRSSLGPLNGRSRVSHEPTSHCLFAPRYLWDAHMRWASAAIKQSLAGEALRAM